MTEMKFTVRKHHRIDVIDAQCVDPKRPKIA